MQKIAIGSDHKGYHLKQKIIDYLKSTNFEIVDEGTFSEDSVDYPDYAYQVAEKVASKQVDLGILICYTGIGMCIVANKVHGIRASLVNNVEDAILTKEHNDSNILCLGAKNLRDDLALEIVKAYINAQFSGGRHLVRLNKICMIEEKEDNREKR